MHTLVVVGTAQFVNVAIKALEFGEKVSAGKVAVNDADRIIGVERSHQIVADGLDRLHVAGSDVTGGADKGKVFH